MKNLLKKVLKPHFLCCTALLAISNGAMATCSIIDARYTPADGFTMNLPTIVVQRDAPVGSIVYSNTRNELNSRSNFIECTTGGFSSQWGTGGALAPVSYGGQTLYASGVAGLAWRVVTPGAGSTAGRYGTGALPRQLNGVACVSGTNYWRLCGGTWGSVRFELVKIATVTGSGMLTTGPLTQANVVGETNIYHVSVGGGAVQTVACSVTNPNITVTMGRTKNTDFSGVGSTSGDADFNINLNCDAATNVKMTISPGSSGGENATNGVLKLDNVGANTASGVGVQVLYNSAPVALGSRMTIATTSADGAYSIPLKARYIQTGAQIVPGKADANATFTMTYQ